MSELRIAHDDGTGTGLPGLFVLSLPRTGSTLLRLLLDSHPAIYCPDELNLGRLLQALYSTQEGLAEQPGPGASMSEVDPDGPPAVATRRLVTGMLAAATAAKGKALWCDKSPSNLESIPLIERIFPQARYLILHRHALDFAMSCLRFSTYGFFLNVVEDYVRKDHRNFLRPLLQAWNDKTAELLDCESRHPDRCCRLLYEDLVASPAASMERVATFLGVEPMPDLVARTFSAPHHQRAYHGDAKAYYSTGINDSSIGSGAELSLSALRLVPAAILDRMQELLAALSYPAAEISASGIDLHLGRQAAGGPQERPAGDPRELFALIDRRLRERSVPAALAGTSFAFVLTGEAGGAWTIDLAQSPAQVRSGRDSSPSVLTLAANDFADIVAGTLNPVLAFQQGKLKLEGLSDPGTLRELLALLLTP